MQQVECGIIAVVMSSKSEAAYYAHLGLHAQQHRGKQAVFIAATDGQQVRYHAGASTVNGTFPRSDQQRLLMEKLKGYAAIGQVRFIRIGGRYSDQEQPAVYNSRYGRLAVAFTGGLANGENLRQDLETGGAILQSRNDEELIAHLIARSNEKDLPSALQKALTQLQGAFSLAVLGTDIMLLARDAEGTRPLALGRMAEEEDAWVFASETCAFDLIGATYEREVKPGHMVTVLKSHGIKGSSFTPASPHRHCAFEHVWLARPDSVVFGRAVAESRLLMGQLLASEAPVEADVVIPLPDAATPIATAYAETLHLPFRMGLVRNHYNYPVEAEEMTRLVRARDRFSVCDPLIKNKRVVLIMNHIFRGVSARKVVNLLKGKASEIHLRVASPQTIRTCDKGVDITPTSLLLANQTSIEGMRAIIGVDSLAFLSLHGLHAALGGMGCYCDDCYTSEKSQLVTIAS